MNGLYEAYACLMRYELGKHLVSLAGDQIRVRMDKLVHNFVDTILFIEIVISAVLSGSCDLCVL